MKLTFKVIWSIVTHDAEITNRFFQNCYVFLVFFENERQDCILLSLTLGILKNILYKK